MSIMQVKATVKLWVRENNASRPGSKHSAKTWARLTEEEPQGFEVAVF